MILLSQCMDLKAKVVDLGYELKFLTCLVVTVLALSLFKVVYFYYNSTQNVRKIRQLLENSRSQWRSGDVTHSRPVSPLPKIERVPTCLSLRRRSDNVSSVRSNQTHEGADHNSSNESMRKLRTSQQNVSHSGTDTIQKIEALQKNSFSSSTDSLHKMKTGQADSPPSRSYIKSSTKERKESPPRRSKNQIISAEMLM
jgi:hypothetical protein